MVKEPRNSEPRPRFGFLLRWRACFAPAGTPFRPVTRPTGLCLAEADIRRKGPFGFPMGASGPVISGKCIRLAAALNDEILTAEINV